MMQGGRDLSTRFLELFLGLFIGFIIGWLARIVYAQSQQKRQTLLEPVNDTDVHRRSEVVLPEADFSPNEEIILTEIIHRGTVKQADLPTLVDLSRSNVSEVVARLEERGYIKRIRTGRTFLVEYLQK